MPPFKINIALACYVSPAPNTLFGEGQWQSVAATKFRRELITEGIITDDLAITPLGRAWIELLLTTPYPTQAWIDPRTGETINV